MIFSFIVVPLVYPITGHWIWGGGWLSAAVTAPAYRTSLAGAS
jgi:Amt family ammonium transporter